MRLGIVGSTCLEGNPAAQRAVLEAILGWRNHINDQREEFVIVSGGAVGVDSMAERIAENLGIPTIIHRPKERRWGGPDGFQARNRLIAGDCSHLLRIACAGSRTYGSGWTRDEARRQGRVVLPEIVLRCAEHGARLAG